MATLVIAHHGIKGQRWGVRRFRNEDGTLTPEGKKRYNKPRVFVSGSSKTQTQDSGYYREELPNDIKAELDSIMDRQANIIVGDAPGIDRQVQNYLKQKKYKDVSVYGPGHQLRYLADEEWDSNPISADEFEPGSKEWLAKKDKAMQDASTEGLAIVLENGGAGATRRNVEALMNQMKNVKVFELKSDGNDQWSNEYLRHHGIKGQQWGVQHGPPYPIDKDTNKIVVKEGTVIARITRYDESKSKGHAYVNYNKQDIQHYRGFFAALQRTKNGPFGHNKPIYSVKLTAKEDLISPSEKERVDTFIELYKDDPTFRNELGGMYKKGFRKWGSKKKYTEKFANLEGDDIANIGFEAFRKGMGGNVYTRSAYFKKLSDKGYNMVLDDLDGGVFGREPAIVFDRNKSLNYEGQFKLTNKEINREWRRSGTKIDKSLQREQKKIKI